MRTLGIVLSLVLTVPAHAGKVQGLEAAAAALDDGLYKTAMMRFREVYKAPDEPGLQGEEHMRDMAILGIGGMYLELGKAGNAMAYVDQTQAGPEHRVLKAHLMLELDGSDGRGPWKLLKGVPESHRSTEWGLLACRAWAARGDQDKARAALDGVSSASGGVFSDARWLALTGARSERADARAAALDKVHKEQAAAWAGSDAPCTP